MTHYLENIIVETNRAIHGDKYTWYTGSCTSYIYLETNFYINWVLVGPPDDNNNIVKAPNTFVVCGDGITYLEHIYEGMYFNTISKNFKQFKGFIAQLIPLVFPTNTSRFQIAPLHCY